MEEAALLTRIAPHIETTTEYDPPPRPEPPALRITLALSTWQAITSPPPAPRDPSAASGQAVGRGRLAELAY